MKKYWPYAAAAAFGLLVFLLQGGDVALSPTRTSWIPAGKDWGYHWVGWLYFRAAPWGLPLGNTPNLLWPVGTTVGFMAGVPWLATLLKLCSPLYPQDIQWVGPYLALCFVLQGWFGARLVAAMTPSRPLQALGGCLFVVAPVLLTRIRHMELCSHFIVLAALACAIRREERARLAPILLPAVAMGIDPYLAFMVLGISFATLLRYRIEGLCSTIGLAIRTALLFALIAGVAALFGFFLHDHSDVAGRGFGFFHSELLSLVNPQGMSRLLPSMPLRHGEGEGFGFLGIGVLSLGLSAIVIEVRARRAGAPRLPWRRVSPLIAMAVVYAVFSWGARISIWGQDIVDLDWLYPGDTADIFRASGRFIWIATYTLTAGTIAIWVIRQPRLAGPLLAFVLVLQCIDSKDIFFAERFGSPHLAPAESPDWHLARGDYDHMVLFPPRCGDGGGVCCPRFTRPPLPSDMYLAVLAVRLGLTYNGFGASRVPRSKHAVACAALQQEVLRGHLDPRSIYVVASDLEATFTRSNPLAPCHRLDDELVCVAPSAVGPFKDKLTSR